MTGNGINQPGNYNVKIGTSFAELVEASGGLKDGVQKIIAGGPMMGMALSTVDVPIVKTSSALTCFMEDEAAKYEETACIRCGKCAQVCPGHVIPQKLMEAAEKHDNAMFVALNGMECCECGCCTYICPARRPLTQAFKQMRQAVAAERRKKG